MSDRIIVMYLGKAVETARAEDLFENPSHPYTKALMAMIPNWDPENRKLRKIRLEGEPPSPINPPPGCSFHPRCLKRMDICTKEMPGVVKLSPGHHTACWLYKDNM